MFFRRITGSSEGYSWRLQTPLATITRLATAASDKTIMPPEETLEETIKKTLCERVNAATRLWESNSPPNVVLDELMALRRELRCACKVLENTFELITRFTETIGVDVNKAALIKMRGTKRD
jgi:hypothetical protein